MVFLLALAVLVAAGAPSEVGVADVWVVEGRVSNNPHQHPIQPSKGQHIVYVDTVAEGQIVAYLTETAPPAGAWARFSGTALRFEAGSKRPGSKKKFPVKQLTVEKVEALPASDAVQALLATKKDSAELRAAIEKAGKDAFPVLIASLPDRRGGHINWAEYWLNHRGQPFEAMRGERQRLIDEYFKSGGGTAEVP